MRRLLEGLSNSGKIVALPSPLVLCKSRLKSVHLRFQLKQLVRENVSRVLLSRVLFPHSVLGSAMLQGTNFSRKTQSATNTFGGLPHSASYEGFPLQQMCVANFSTVKPFEGKIYRLPSASTLPPRCSSPTDSASRAVHDMPFLPLSTSVPDFYVVVTWDDRKKLEQIQKAVLRPFKTAKHTRHHPRRYR